MQEKSDFILAFTDATADVAQVGGKGASLARMVIAGLPVPTGFYITTNSYRRFVEANGIQPRLLDALNGKDLTDPATLESVSRLIQGYFTAGFIPVEVADAISEAYSTPMGVPVAVRSSATAERFARGIICGSAGDLSQHLRNRRSS